MDIISNFFFIFFLFIKIEGKIIFNDEKNILRLRIREFIVSF